MWWIWHGAKWPPTLRPGQTTRTVSPPVGCQKPHPPSPFIIISQLESWCSFYHPTEGRRLSRRGHCSKGVQSVPKAVYRSGVYNKHATAHSTTRDALHFEALTANVWHTAVRHVTTRPLRPGLTLTFRILSSAVSSYLVIVYCKTHIFRVHQIFANFASRIKSWN